MFVIDASVVAKWFIEEKDSAKAILLKENHVSGKDILIAPDILIYELANALLFSKLFNPAGIERCLKNLFELEIDFVNPSPDFIFSAVELACDKQTTIYDASYLAIASELNIKLITADEKLYNSTKSLQCVELISNI